MENYFTFCVNTTLYISKVTKLSFQKRKVTKLFSQEKLLKLFI